MDFQSPPALIAEHKELHAELAKAIASGGRTGEAAERVEKALGAHFPKEEAFAIPPLGLLDPIAKDQLNPEMAAILPMTDRLQAEMPQMLADHQEILQALGALSDAARAEGKTEAEQFAERLKMHAQLEEQLSYPAAILVGKYVRIKLKK